MTSREIIRRVERLETCMGAERQRLQFTIHFIDPDGSVVDTLVLSGDGNPGLSKRLWPAGGRGNALQKTPPTV